MRNMRHITISALCRRTCREKSRIQRLTQVPWDEKVSIGRVLTVYNVMERQAQKISTRMADVARAERLEKNCFELQYLGAGVVKVYMEMTRRKAGSRNSQLAGEKSHCR